VPQTLSDSRDDDELYWPPMNGIDSADRGEQLKVNGGLLRQLTQLRDPAARYDGHCALVPLERSHGRFFVQEAS